MAITKLEYSDLPMTTATANTTYVHDADENALIQNGVMIDVGATAGLKFVLNGSLYSGGGIMRYGTDSPSAPGVRVSIGQTGYLESDNYGLYTAADGSVIENRGVISTGSKAIDMLGDDMRFQNFGFISAQSGDAIQIDGNNARVENAGIVSGGIRVTTDAGFTSTIINSGEINTASTGVAGGNGDDTVINSGLIRRNISFYAGDDTFIDRGGKVTGVILGGSGDDLYVIRSNEYDIREYVGEGFDTVKTFVSWELDQKFESGRLMGKKNIDLTASDDGTFLYGNIGDNRLTGGGGVDSLEGGRGDDVLEGQGGADIFVFKAGSGSDTILDFQDGADKINLQSYNGIDSFNDFDIKQSGKNLVIDLGDGDTITLRNFDKADLSEADFML